MDNPTRDEKLKEKIVTRTFSMYESESGLIEQVNQERDYRNSSMAFRQILHEWRKFVLDAGKSDLIVS